VKKYSNYLRDGVPAGRGRREKKKGGFSPCELKMDFKQGECLDVNFAKSWKRSRSAAQTLHIGNNFRSDEGA